MRYKRYFPTLSSPWLGMPEGPSTSSRDIAELPADVEHVAINKKFCRNIDQLPRFKRIRVVSMSDFEPEWIEPLEQLPKLEHLRLSTLRGVTKLPAIKNLAKLRSLVMTRCKGLNLSFLKGSGIHSLCLADFGDRELDVKHVGGLGELRELYISGGLKIKSLTPLGKLAELRYLFLFFKAVRGEPSVRPLGKLSKLETVQLTPRLQVEQLDYLFERWPKVKQIKLNAGLTWPPPGPKDARPSKGKVRIRAKQEGNIYTAEHDI